MKYIVYFLLWSTIQKSLVSSAEIRVPSGGSIQDAVDAAVAGDTIILEPGNYQNNDINATYAVHITKSNIRLIGEPTTSNKVVLTFLPGSLQEIGVFVAPPDCDYNAPSTEGGCSGSTVVSDIEMIGITVEDFPRHGIQTRRVDGFAIRECHAFRNLRNGFNVTISTNGVLQGNSASGSRETGMVCSGCDNVSMLDNKLFDNTNGIQITVSNNVVIRNNSMYNNSIGLGLFHPNYSFTPQLPVMKNWTVEENVIYDNNKKKIGDEPNGTLYALLPGGFGILLIGTSDHIVRKNTIRDNGTTGLAIIGHCTGQALGDPTRPCSDEFPPFADPSTNNNLISLNTFQNNGNDQDPVIGNVGLPGVDLLYLVSPSLNETGDGNCFELKLRTTHFAIVDGEPLGRLGQQLPNGCGVFPGFFRRSLNRLYTLPKIIFRIFF